MPAEAPDFYLTIPVVADFAEAVKPANYRPLPDDWVVGFSDVKGSTQAVANGRYKAVNMIGAGVIAAVANALGRKAFPFVFGGDGASFAVGPADAEAAKDALAAMAAFSRSEFDLELRVAAVTVNEIRAGGRDIRVARYGASPHLSYAMFAGGGLSWFESRAKAGEFALPAAPEGARPDLSDLSCRWGRSPAKHGVILSVIAAPRGDDPRFQTLIDEVVAMALAAADGGRPISTASLGVGRPDKAISIEAAAISASGVSRGTARMRALASYVLGFVFRAFNLRAGNFDMAQYVEDVVGNADFRKFDDGLRLTLDCSPEFADKLEARLAAAGEYAEYGAFRQSAAQITCYVPSVNDRGHVHFVDGADGGYTMAAKAMKARRG